MPKTAVHADADFVRDTSPEALAVFFEIQRRRLPEQKFADAFDLSEGLFELVKAGIRLRHPAAEDGVPAVLRYRLPELLRCDEPGA